MIETMRSEKEIRQRIDELEELASYEVNGSPSHAGYRGKIQALKWVLRNHD